LEEMLDVEIENREQEKLERCGEVNEFSLTEIIQNWDTCNLRSQYHEKHVCQQRIFYNKSESYTLLRLLITDFHDTKTSFDYSGVHYPCTNTRLNEKLYFFMPLMTKPVYKDYFFQALMECYLEPLKGAKFDLDRLFSHEDYLLLMCVSLFMDANKITPSDLRKFEGYQIGRLGKSSKAKIVKFTNLLREIYIMSGVAARRANFRFVFHFVAKNKQDHLKLYKELGPPNMFRVIMINGVKCKTNRDDILDTEKAERVALEEFHSHTDEIFEKRIDAFKAIYSSN